MASSKWFMWNVGVQGDNLALEEKDILHKYLHLYLKMRCMEVRFRSGKKQKNKNQKLI